RRERLIGASEHFDFVELEGDRDLTSSLLDRIPPEKRIVSCHAPAADRRVLQRRFSQLSATPARYYRFSCPAECAAQAAVPLAFLKSLDRSDVIAYATGAAGAWTSVIAPAFGWPIVFGTVADRADAHDGLSVARLVGDYGLPQLRTYRELYGIVGNPVSHSLSPRIHNAAYLATNQPAIFVPLLVEDFGQFWQSFVTDGPLAELDLTVQGFTVASPHKESASQFLADKSETVQSARSSNLVHLRNGKWRTDTTDPHGVLLNLRAHSIPLAGNTVAVVGCGGSGRAIAAALSRAGSAVTMFNRNPERGRRAMQLLGVPFVPLSKFRADAFSVVVNATPVGRDGHSCPFEPNRLRDGTVVIDHVYASQVTPLVEFARARGLTTIDGRDILCTQAARQFQCMTGQPMPPGLVEELSCLPGTHAIASHNNHSSPTMPDQQCLSES
ncbi:MAG: type I 3-dehydroquinate dehydratase, partial [Planctomycetota bacterium]